MNLGTLKGRNLNSLQNILPCGPPGVGPPRRWYLVCPHRPTVSQVNFKMGQHQPHQHSHFSQSFTVLCKCFASQMEALKLIVIQVNSLKNLPTLK